MWIQITGDRGRDDQDWSHALELCRAALSGERSRRFRVSALKDKAEELHNGKYIHDYRYPDTADVHPGVSAAGLEAATRQCHARGGAGRRQAHRTTESPEIGRASCRERGLISVGLVGEAT